MIRKFIQCKNTKQRLELMLSTTVNDWEEGELNTVMQIFGLPVSEEASKEGEWAMVLNHLLLLEYADEKEISKSDKIFQDAQERLGTIEGFEKMSDFNAYLAVCRQSASA